MSYYAGEDIEDVGEDIGEAVWRRPNYQYGRQSYVPPRPRPGAATNQQVTTAFDKVGGDVRTLASQVKVLEQKFDTSQARTSRALAATRNDLNQTKMMSALLPMLSRPETKTVAENVTGGAAGATVVFSKDEKLVKASDDTMGMILPLFLLMGTGTGESGTQQGGMDSTMMMVLVLALTMRKKS